MVVMAPSDGKALYDAAEALADAAGVPFVPGRSGHGWELLVDPVAGAVTRIGRRLIDGRDGLLSVGDGPGAAPRQSDLAWACRVCQDVPVAPAGRRGTAHLDF